MENYPIENERARRQGHEGMHGLYILDVIALVVLVIGGLNWLTIGIFNFNFVHAIVGFTPMVERIVYVLVGLCAVYVAVITPVLVNQFRHGTERRPAATM